MNTQTKTMLDHALDIARRGLPVFRIAAGQKSPPMTGWQAAATTDEAAIRKMWAADPTANIGISTAGFLVLDVDTKNGKDGFATLAAVEAKLPQELEATLEVETPTKGRHLFYKLPAGTHVRSSQGDKGGLGSGLDVRADGGYVVAFGSRTEHGKYTIYADEPIAEADPELIRLCGERRQKSDHKGADVPAHINQEVAAQRAKEWLKTRAPAVEGQGGDAWTYQTICMLRDQGVARAEMIDVLAVWNEKCLPPWDTDALQTKVNNAFAYAQNAPGADSMEEVLKHFKPLSPDELKAADEAAEAIKKAKGEPATFKPATRSARYLKETPFKPIMFTIDDFLPEGAFLLVAAPKIGKSWLTLQLAIAVATGGEVLGFKAKQGDVLVLALEDSYRRLKSRLGKLGFNDLPDEALDRLHFETNWPRTDKGGLEALEKWLDEHPDTRLVVIDVLECFRPQRDGKTNAYTDDYASVKAIQALAARRGISIVIVHHTRKQQADDSMQRISGTNGLGGAADGVLILDRERGADEGDVEVLARDLPKDGAYALRFREGQWSMIGPAGQVAKTALQNEILAALRADAKPMKQVQIARAIGRSQSTISQALQVMVRDKSVLQSKAGYAPASNEFEPIDDGAFDDDGDKGGTPAT
jgi:hypothetical protein